MSRNPKTQRNGLILFIFTLTLLHSSIIQLNGHTQETSASTLQTYLIVNPEELYQNDHFNMSLSITNIRYEDVLNVSINIQIPNEIEFISSSVADLEVEDDSSELDYTYGLLKFDEAFIFTVTYNVTSSSTQTLTLEGANVSFRLIEGFPDYTISNSVNLGLNGVRDKTDTATLLPLPPGPISPDDILIIFAYIFPIGVFGLTIFILRRLRRR